MEDIYELDENIVTAMSSYKAQVEKYGIPISEDLYKELRDYADDNGIGLSGFRDFVGDIEVIKTVIDDIVEIAKDFPLILAPKTGISLELDYDMGTDFATTKSEHIIHLNAVYYADLIMLENDYQEAVREGRFVRNTDWRAIARHEVGHVVANIYHLNPIQIALDIFETKSVTLVLSRLRDILSIYSAEYVDGREIISESFAAYYSDADIDFAKDYINRCLMLIKKGGD